MLEKLFEVKNVRLVFYNSPHSVLISKLSKLKKGGKNSPQMRSNKMNQE